MGEAAPQPEGSSVCAQKAPARLGFLLGLPIKSEHQNLFYALFLAMYVTTVLQEMQVQSLGQEDPLEKEMATHSSILAWRIPWSPRRPGSTFWVRQGLLGWGQRRGEGGQGLRSGLDSAPS